MKLNINLSFCSTEDRQSLQDWNNMREGKWQILLLLLLVKLSVSSCNQFAIWMAYSKSAVLNRVTTPRGGSQRGSRGGSREDFYFEKFNTIKLLWHILYCKKRYINNSDLTTKHKLLQPKPKRVFPAKTTGANLRYVVKNHCYKKPLWWMTELFALRSLSLTGLPKLGNHTIQVRLFFYTAPHKYKKHKI